MSTAVFLQAQQIMRKPEQPTLSARTVSAPIFPQLNRNSSKPLNMLISGLVLTLSEARPERETVLARLRAIAGVELGEPNGRWLPITTCAASDEESRLLHETVGALPGVRYADVVAVHFEPEESDEVPAGAAALPPLL
jgi:hypothetical protein